MFGYDDETGEPLVYIGETEDAIERLSVHAKKEEKNYWIEAIVFISKDDNLNKAHIKYLESRFYEICIEVDRYKIMNTIIPKKSAISEPDTCEMEDFLENIILIVSSLGHKVFEKLRTDIHTVGDVESIDLDNLLCFKQKDFDAKGKITSEGFVVLKGSKINNTLAKNSVGNNTIKLREQYALDGSVANYELTKDILFKSPSAAGKFVSGYSVSGPQSWVNSEGVTLKDIQ
ncbi:MAG: GIY-YIG nuclease family protein [Bacilli bacterium]